MKKIALLARALIVLALLPTGSALALGSGLVNGKATRPGSTGLSGKSGSSTPFGGLGSSQQNGIRPQDLRRPTASSCALKEQSGRPVGGRSSRQDASGRLHLSTDASASRNQSGNIYGNCDGPIAPGRRSASSKTKLVTSYDKSTGTLKQARDGYYNRSATSSMMPRKVESAYDPVTGVLKPSRTQNSYRIYQQ